MTSQFAVLRCAESLAEQVRPSRRAASGTGQAIRDIYAADERTYKADEQTFKARRADLQGPTSGPYMADERTWKFAFVSPVNFAWEAPEGGMPPSRRAV
jgi:hypothetical protein